MSELEALQLLRRLDEGVAAKTGASFFPHLVSSLAQTLDATCAFVSDITQATYQAHVLAYWSNGSFREPFTYSLAGTPCECVLDNQIVAFTRNISEMFPKDRAWFASLKAQSFLAIPLCTEDGKVRGHLAVLDSRERDWGEVDFEILKIFSTRAGAELERRDYERRLESANAALQKANAQMRREVTQRIDAQEQLASSEARSEHIAELIRVINSGITSNTGAEFFRELTRSLAAALDVHTVFVAQIDAVTYEADILAMWTGGSYDPTGRLDGQIAAFARRVVDLFPASREILESRGIHSYLAIPITGELGPMVGYIAVQDQRERDWNETELGILRLFANRAAVELKRRDHEKNLENANTQLQKANAALRREVATRLDMEDQLARAKKAAEAASTAKSNFLAHMSHELRTPLNGILGYAQLLKRDATLGEHQIESVSVIERSGEHLLTLINDLLDLAKIEAGRLDVHTSLFDLPQLVKHVADIAAVRAAQADIEFSYKTEPGLPMQVRGDERALRQVLLNLLGNAVKFTRQGSVSFHATARSIAIDRCEMCFVVEDTGPGIEAEDLQRIFEPFERVSADPKVEGTGLGLPIAKRLASAMGGQLEVRSTPGRGSTFVVTLQLEVVGHSHTVVVDAAVPPTSASPRPHEIPVSTEWAAQLLHLAMQGDIKELVARAEQAVDSDVAGAPVYREIQRLARKFDFKGIRRVLQDATKLTV
jgi:two-component system, sensor histidine kinase and response regulator